MGSVVDIFKRERAHENLTPGERALLRAFYGVLFSLASAAVYTLVEWANQRMTLQQLWPALVVALGGVLLSTFKTYASSWKDPPLVTKDPAPQTVTELVGQAEKTLTDPMVDRGLLQEASGALTADLTTSGPGPSATQAKS